MIKKILNFAFLLIMFFVFITNVKADELTSFDFMDKGNTSFIIGSNSYISGNFAISVQDSTQTKPYINLLIATTGYPDFIINENDYFSNTVIKKLYSSGTSNVNGYSADLYVVQFATRGTGWNCSSQGLNCYINTTLKLNNNYSYNSSYQLQSIALTDTVLTDDYLANMQINQNNQIIEQGKETNDKLNDLNDAINNNFNECRPSVNLFDDSTFVQNDIFGSSSNIIVSSRQILYLNPGTYTFSSDLDLSTYNYAISIAPNIPAIWGTVFSFDSGFTSSSNLTFSISSGGYFIIALNKSNGSSITVQDINSYNLQLQIGETATTFEEYGKEVCKNKIDETNDKLDSVNGSINDLNNSLTNSNSSDATNSAGNFFSGFETDTFGLTSIITAPLDLIGSITSSSCTPLPLTVPFVDISFSLPCMSTIYEEHFGSFLNIYQTITFGIVAYWVCVRIFALVKDFKNPDHDEIEVLDL